MNLANALSNKGHKVVLWSSVFYHQKKQHRYKKFTKIHIFTAKLLLDFLIKPINQ